MMASLHVTDHAIRQFRQRIAPLPEEEARRIIADTVERTPLDTWRLTSNRSAICIKSRRPFQFRALVRPGERGLAVVTILKHGKRGANRARLEAYRAAVAH